MDLNEKVAGLEGELKLVKSEIKKVLMDLRVIMNDLENPFVSPLRLREMMKETEEKGIDAEALREMREDEEEKLIEAEEEVEAVEPEAIMASLRRKGLAAKKGKPAKAKVKGVGAGAVVGNAGKIDIFALTQLMKWTDSSLSNIGKDKLMEILALYDLTGRMPQEIGDTIIKIAQLSNAPPKKEGVEMKDCVLAIYQLDRIISGEPQTPFMLSDDELSKWLKM
jgi:hypothetical protein